MQRINGNDLYNMFTYGATYLVKERKHLNEINVFPVADGDTGNNLVHTIQTILRESDVDESFYKTLDSISESALIGARGNSGIIFAQFVNGLRIHSKEKDDITVSEFSTMVEKSSIETKLSISNPTEGTMLTIIHEFSTFLKEEVDHSLPLVDIFSKAYHYLEGVLEKTKDMLGVLKKANVVDSGAKGFLLFVRGIFSYFNKDDLDVTKYENLTIEDSHIHQDEPEYRYCTEGLLENCKISKADLKDILQVYGDSIVVLEGKKSIRIHIHTNRPENMFHELSKIGHIVSQKVDDMTMDIKLKQSNSSRVLVTDSIADIPQKIIDENNVVVIPLNISYKDVNYYDKLTISNQILFNKLIDYSDYPTTSVPSMKYIDNLFLKLLLYFKEILVITVASELSGTHNVIKKEAEKLQKNGKSIYVVDSLNNSATQGLLVNKAIDLMKNDLKLKDIKEKLDDIKARTRILVCLDTFEYATRSGRVPKIIGKIGMKLGLRPIMSLDEKGKGAAFGLSFTKKGITKRIKKIVEKDLNKSGIEEYNIVHCINFDLAKEYQTMFKNIIGKQPKYISDISTATAIHSGVGSVAIGYIKQK
ncbi:MAG: DegV family EDD domain-containing protein [Candidatus Izimaplasma sp.]|nr:DegV family EDD domain-containing protein [Candidatus Izimaplasma bacterium]